MAEERARIREALMDLVLANGYEATTVDQVVERSRVSRAEFDLHFAGLEDCYLKVYEENTAAFDTAVFTAFDGPGPWRERLRAAAYAAARFISDHPREVGFGVNHMFSAGPMAQVHREQQLHRMVDLIDAGRQELDDPDSLGRGVAEGVVGSIYGPLIKQLQEDRGTRAAEAFVPELMYIAVRPYLGHEVAREELTIPPPGLSANGD